MSFTDKYLELTKISVRYKDGSFCDIIVHLPVSCVINDYSKLRSLEEIEHLKKQYVFNWESKNLDWENIESINDEWSGIDNECLICPNREECGIDNEKRSLK